MGRVVNFVDPNSGITYAVNADDPLAVRAAQEKQWVPESPEDLADRTVNARVAADYNTTGDKLAGGLAAVGRGASLGLSDAALRAAGVDSATLNNQRESLGGWATPLELTGAVAPTLLSGGAAAPETLGGRLLAGAPTTQISRLGSMLARTGEGAGTLAKAGRAALGAGVEGGLYSAGQTASDLALADDPGSVEHIAGSLSSSFYTGNLVNAPLGGGLSLFESTLGAAGKRLRAAKAADEAASKGEVAADLAGLDKKQLVAARDAEKAQLEAALVPQRAALGTEIDNYRTLTKTPGSDIAEPWVAVATGSKAEKLAAKAAAQRTAKVATRADVAAKVAEEEATAAEAALAKYGATATTAPPPSLPTYDTIGDGVVEASVPARSLAGRIRSLDAGINETGIARARKYIAEGQREPIEVLVRGDGSYEVVNGRHRLLAAMEADAPIRVRVERGVADVTGDPTVPLGEKYAGATAATPAQTWKEFTAERMGPAMKETGSHGAAMKKLGEEWKAYKAARPAEVAGPIDAAAARNAAEQAATKARAAATAARDAAEKATADAAAAATKLEAVAVPYPRWMREQQKLYMEGDKYLDRVLRNPKALAENPRLAKAALQQQEHALELIESRSKELAAFHVADTSGRRTAALARVPEALKANRALQAKIESLAAPASERLASLTHAIESYEPAKMSMRQKIGAGLAFGATVGGVGYLAQATGIPIPGIGVVAPILGAAAGSAVSSKLGAAVAKTTAASRERAIKAVDAFVTGTRALRKVTPPLASKVLAAARFAPDDSREQPRNPSLLDSYNARSQEVARITQPGPDGKLTIRPHVRAAIESRLDPIGITAPHLADRLATHAVAKVEFLASKMPRTVTIGMTKIPPSELAIRAWARYIAAADDPSGIEERLAHGTVTPEDREVMQTLYPERMADLVRQVVEKQAELRRTLPFRQRLVLSNFTGAAVDATMEPRILAALQGHYKAEPGTEGGTRAPVPRPQFGSVKKPEGTPAQQRAG